ncbi:ROK family transcriptional regulator [Actinomadura alba]|uniref:ROK family transcriptional regulator n=1 Tax=Actinomadura alba TaxID=406431 RepID=A0ABR7LHX9_9ACTN|nr:ROK family transcriptional regulator [Actinomadura alba]
MLRHVHAHPEVTRAELTRALGLSSGSATEITARLKALRLVDEVSAPPTGGRGRPSPALTAHPEGPLVCAVDVGHERWRVVTVELGGALLDESTGRHRDRDSGAVLAVLRRRIAEARERHGHRLRAVAVAVAGTVQGTRIVQASTLRWRDVTLDGLCPDPSIPLLAGNDASLAGLAEARRGAGAGVKALLHLTVEVGIGGVLVMDGRMMTGATDAGGEFGHLPFGDPRRRCPCGAHGCWDLEVDGRAMARALGRPAPHDPRADADVILAEAASGDPASRAAVGTAATALGRGVAGLVNALDPALVTLSGLGCGLIETAPEELGSAYLGGLMSFRHDDPPPLLASTLRGDGTIIGGAEVGFDAILTDEGLESWSAAVAGA